MSTGRSLALALALTFLGASSASAGSLDLETKAQPGLVGVKKANALPEWVWQGELTYPSDDYDWPAIWQSIQLADIGGSWHDDLCVSKDDGLYCALGDGSAFGPLTRWLAWSPVAIGAWEEGPWEDIVLFSGAGWHHGAVCGVTPAGGARCRYSNGSSFATPTADPDPFDGAGEPVRSTIQFLDLDRDGWIDVCARDADGTTCHLYLEGLFVWTWLGAMRFDGLFPWPTVPGDLLHGDVTGDGVDDLCGRSHTGVWCAAGRWVYDCEPDEWCLGYLDGFDTATKWTSFFGGSGTWMASYHDTLQLVTEGLYAPTLCGRWADGVHCGASDGAAFVFDAHPEAPAFSDANGWSEERFWRSLVVHDQDGDGVADICGRGWGGIYCSHGVWEGDVTFGAPELVIDKFGDADGYGSDPALWWTVQPTDAGPGRPWCGRAYLGIACFAP